MLKNNSRFSAALSSIYGPYRKRGDKLLRIERVGSKPTLLSLRSVRENIDLSPTVSIKALSSGSLEIKAPAHAKISAASFLHWQTIWDGTKATLKQPVDPAASSTDASASSVCLAVQTSGIRIETDQGNWILNFSEQSDFEWSAFVAGLSDPAMIWNWGKSICESGAVHVALFAAILFSSQLNFSWLHSEKAIEQEKRLEARKQIIVPVEMLAALNAQSDYNGRNLTLNNPTTAAHKTEKIASGISSLVAKMANLNFGDLSNIKISGAQKDVDDAAVQSLKDKLSQGDSADLKSAFQSLGKGNGGKAFQWDISGVAKQGMLTSKDQEEVAQIFRSLQENFRNCYESALLKNEDLSVTVNYEAGVLPSGYLGAPSFSISGRSTPSGEDTLKSCLTNVLKPVKVKQSLSGLKIRNQLIFKS